MPGWIGSSAGGVESSSTSSAPRRLALSIKAIVCDSMNVHTNRSDMVKKGWSRPPAGKVKLNTHDVVNLDTRNASTGCIIQDSQGKFLSACRVEIEGIIDVAMAETQALRDGVRLAKRNGCNNVEVESDSLEVVNVFLDPMQGRP